MATYPIKLLRDEEGTDFVPLTTTESVMSGDGSLETRLSAIEDTVGAVDAILDTLVTVEEPTLEGTLPDLTSV